MTGGSVETNYRPIDEILTQPVGLNSLNISVALGRR